MKVNDRVYHVHTGPHDTGTVTDVLPDGLVQVEWDTNPSNYVDGDGFEPQDLHLA